MFPLSRHLQNPLLPAEEVDGIREVFLRFELGGVNLVDEVSEVAEFRRCGFRNDHALVDRTGKNVEIAVQLLADPGEKRHICHPVGTVEFAVVRENIEWEWLAALIERMFGIWLFAPIDIEGLEHVVNRQEDGRQQAPGILHGCFQKIVQCKIPELHMFFSDEDGAPAELLAVYEAVADEREVKKVPVGTVFQQVSVLLKIDEAEDDVAADDRQIGTERHIDRFLRHCPEIEIQELFSRFVNALALQVIIVECLEIDGGGDVAPGFQDRHAVEADRIVLADRDDRDGVGTAELLADAVREFFEKIRIG